MDQLFEYSIVKVTTIQKGKIIHFSASENARLFTRPTALQVSIDASTISQEDSRIAVNCQRIVQHTLTIGGCVCELQDCKRLHSIQKSLLHNHCAIKHILSQNNDLPVLRIK